VDASSIDDDRRRYGHQRLPFFQNTAIIGLEMSGVMSICNV